MTSVKSNFVRIIESVKAINMTKVLFLVFVLLISIEVSAQKKYFVKKITYEQGLSENTINCVAQDPLGYIWVGTREGLNRYDGYS